GGGGVVVVKGGTEVSWFGEERGLGGVGGKMGVGMVKGEGGGENEGWGGMKKMMMLMGLMLRVMVVRGVMVRVMRG
ncbi:hypothetical protein, partial [Micrococcus luteus]|uniref:hypothetical protein n=1 Tax=Micrococcus luteus TaxID=1270 RepID=UPI0021B1CC46